MHQRETGSKTQASRASNTGRNLFKVIEFLKSLLYKKFRGEMQMSSREGSEQNYENNNVSLNIQNKTNFKTL